MRLDFFNSAVIANSKLDYFLDRSWMLVRFLIEINNATDAPSICKQRLTLKARMEQESDYAAVDPGEGPGGTPPPHLFLDQTEDRKKLFGDRSPLFCEGLDDRAPPLSQGTSFVSQFDNMKMTLSSIGNFHKNTIN